MNLLEPGLAFVEGLALIASPCILPVLPLVLSASVEGGRRRPFGIILGFVLAFSVFALASRKLVAAFHIDLDIIKDGSLLLLFLFGLVLLSEKLSQAFSQLTQGAANLGNSVASGGKDGFFSGILIGALIGLVWTPCAGPILAAVLVQVIRQQSDAMGAVMIASFALGAAVPMLVIALTGRKIMQRMGFLTNHAEAVRKAFGALIILSVAFIASGIDAQSLFKQEKKVSTSDGLRLEQALSAPYPAPEFTGIETWINSEPLSMAGLKGKVVLVDFWTYSCINCVRTLPYITQWDAKYHDKGLVIVGVHSPEFEFEKDAANVRNAVVARGIHYPVALDNHLDTWSNFHNRYWPAHYLIDRDGKVVYTHFGEGEYEVTENNIRYLLGLKGKAESMAAPVTHTDGQTPETYLGYERMEHFAGKEEIAQDKTARYHFPESLPADSWALDGLWTVEGQKITAATAGVSLRLHFNARKVFLVLGTSSGAPVTASVTLNGEAVGDHAGKDAPMGKVTVEHNTLYELIDQPETKGGLLEIKADGPGLEAYAFTFGS